MPVRQRLDQNIMIDRTKVNISNHLSGLIIFRFSSVLQQVELVEQVELLHWLSREEGTEAEMEVETRLVPCRRWADFQKYYRRCCQRFILTCRRSAWIHYWRPPSQASIQGHYGCCCYQTRLCCRHFHQLALVCLVVVLLILHQTPVACSYLPKRGDCLHRLGPDQVLQHFLHFLQKCLSSTG